MGRLVLRGGRLLAPDAGSFIAGRALVIEDGRIIDAVADGAAPSAWGDATVIDLDGRWIVPGLVDAHCHLISPSAEVVDDELIARGTIEGVTIAGRLVAAGVTSVRDPGCRHRGIYALRAAIDAGMVPGPRVYASGPNVTGAAAPRAWRNVIGDGPADMRRLVRAEAEAGAQWIKLVVSQVGSRVRWKRTVWFMTREEIAAAVDEAHRCGLRVGCHCEGREAAEAVIAAGVDCIDHGTDLDDSQIARMVAAGIDYVPTTWAYSTRRMIEEGNFASELAELHGERVQRRHRDAVARAAAAGVRIAAGSDAGRAAPGDLLAELRTLAACGLGPAALLRAATVDGAAVAAGPDRGTIAPGQQADLVALDGDPLDDIDSLGRVALVVQGGRVVRDARERA